MVWKRSKRSSFHQSFERSLNKNYYSHPEVVYYSNLFHDLELSVPYLLKLFLGFQYFPALINYSSSTHSPNWNIALDYAEIIRCLILLYLSLERVLVIKSIIPWGVIQRNRCITIILFYKDTTVLFLTSWLMNPWFVCIQYTSLCQRLKQNANHSINSIYTSLKYITRKQSQTIWMKWKVN